MLAERGSGEELPLPETVQGIIAARLDSLAPDEKALLQDAAVIGKVFGLGAVGATDQQLNALRQKDFVQRARRSSVEGETEFAFKHALVRDVAYGQIPRAERAGKHRRAAEWIQSLGRPEDHAEMVAHHYVNALELARAAGQDDTDLVSRARPALREAGDRAMTLNAWPQAETYFRRALELSSADDPERPGLLLRCGRALYLRNEEGAAELAEARAGLLAAGDREAAAEAALMLADIAWKEGRSDEMAGHLEDARALVEDTARSRAQVAVLCEVARYDMLADSLEAAHELGVEALGLAEELGFDDLRAHALNTVGVARADSGDPAGFGQVEESIALATRSNSIPDLLRGHNNLAALYFLHGDLERTRAAEKTTLDLANHFGHRGQARFIETGAFVGNRYMAGEWDAALGRESELAEVAERESFKSPWLRAALAFASRDFRAAADIHGEMGVVAHEAFFRLRAAEQLLAEGRRAEADEQLRPALAFYRDVGATRYVREGEALLAASA